MRTHRPLRPRARQPSRMGHRRIYGSYRTPAIARESGDGWGCPNRSVEHSTEREQRAHPGSSNEGSTSRFRHMTLRVTNEPGRTKSPASDAPNFAAPPDVSVIDTSDREGSPVSIEPAIPTRLARLQRYRVR